MAGRQDAQCNARDTLHIDQVHPDLRLDETLLERFVHGVLEEENQQLAYLGIILAGHELVRELNRKYRGGDYETDVLSFSLGEETGVVNGEVYVDLDTALAQHKRFAATFEEEAGRYVVHGLLHLLGYDDVEPTGREVMRRLEDRYLEKYWNL